MRLPDAVVASDVAPVSPTLTRRSLALLLLTATLLVVLVPAPLYAWTPGTHVFLGDALLRNLSLIPPHVAELLAAFPSSFLYGSIAADTSIAKKYADVGRHCHSWHIGLEIHEQAQTPSLRAFAIGYLAHLAADVVAHNFFVPRQLAITSSTTGIGHSYWESRIDTHIGEQWPRRARELLILDHAAADQHLDGILSPTLFGTATNRRIFRGMVYVTDTDSWQRIFQLVSENSRWDLSDADVGRYLARSFDYVVDLLNRWDASEPFDYDPSGDGPLREAKKVRRTARRQGGDIRAALEADRMFGMPVTPLRFAQQLPMPIFQPLRDDKS
ncbi:MAG: zinc dependent phospholipase C family protein [Gemmatimonadaceae bacterium]|nr:zinc dependent phospholipase C family protein [Gemmatimonadaceae bacterium]